MDVKQYYRKLREVEANLSDPYVLVKSLETPDGGRAGVLSEVTRQIAAKMIVEGRAVTADEEDRKTYLAQQGAAKKAAQKAELARRVQVAIITDPDLEAASEKRNNDPAGSRK